VVVVLSTTDSVKAYVPVPGLKVGVETVDEMVYAAEVTALLVQPVSYAMALIVSVLATATGPLYTAPTVSLGVLPSVV